MEACFPISVREVGEIIDLLQGQLASGNCPDIDSWQAALAAFRRLPTPTENFSLNLTFAVRDYCLMQWVAIEMTDEYLCFSTGEHFHEPGVGGDITSEIQFECQPDGWQSSDYRDGARRLSSFDSEKISTSLDVDL